MPVVYRILTNNLFLRGSLTGNQGQYNAISIVVQLTKINIQSNLLIIRYNIKSVKQYDTHNVIKFSLFQDPANCVK